MKLYNMLTSILIHNHKARAILFRHLLFIFIEGRSTHSTIANLFECSPKRLKRYGCIAPQERSCAVDVPYRNKDVSLKQGLSVGAVWLLHSMARQLGIADALGTTQQGNWRYGSHSTGNYQGSRLSAVRLAGSHAACVCWGLGSSTKTSL